MTIKNPTCGRIVHVYMNGGLSLNCKFPALVLSDGEPNLKLLVFTDNRDRGDMAGIPLPSFIIEENMPHKEDAIEGKPYWDWPITPPNVRP